MKKIGVICLFAISVCFSAQSKKEMISAIQKFQTDLNAEFNNPKETPLRGDNFDTFKEHPFFPIDLKYRVKAIFVRTKNAIAFEMCIRDSFWTVQIFLKVKVTAVFRFPGNGSFRIILN